MPAESCYYLALDEAGEGTKAERLKTTIWRSQITHDVTAFGGGGQYVVLGVNRGRSHHVEGLPRACHRAEYVSRWVVRSGGAQEDWEQPIQLGFGWKRAEGHAFYDDLLPESLVGLYQGVLNLEKFSK